MDKKSDLRDEFNLYQMSIKKIHELDAGLISPLEIHTHRVSIPISVGTDPGLAGSGVIFLHLSLQRYDHTFNTEYRAECWIDDQQDGKGNRIKIKKLHLNMYGFWDGGNNTATSIIENADYADTGRKKDACDVGPIPSPCMHRSDVYAYAECWIPSHVGPIKAQIKGY